MNKCNRSQLTLFLHVLLSHVWLFLDPINYSPPGSSICGISQARILGGLPFPSPRDLPDPGIQPTSPSWQVDPLPLSQLRRSYHNVECGTSLDKGRRKTKFTWNQRRVRKAGEVHPVSINKLVVFLVSTKLDTHQRPVKKRVQEWSGKK